MSRQIRHRVTGVALAVLFAAAPLLSADQAHADWAQSGDRVVFGGEGVFGLPCAARPDLESLQVPANSTVQVVNSTGHGANLVLDGKSLGGIPNTGSTQVVFHHGTVSLSLQPDCLLREESAPVLVTAAPSAGPLPSSVVSIPTPTSPPGPTATPVPTTSGPTRPVPTTSGPSRPTPTATPRPDPTPTRTRTTRPTRRPDTTPTTSAPHTRRPSATPTPTRTSRSTTTRNDRSNDTPTPTGTPSAAPTSSAPATTESPEADDELFLDDGPAMELAPSVEPSAPAGSAAEPVAALEPLSRSGSTGLLALVAAVCVTGVMVGAFRTIAAQRASRANMA